MNYVTRKNGATVTVFVPYDCHNNCPFCINKQDYRKIKSNPKKIISSIKEMHVASPYCDFVITGGEPFADLDILQQIIDAICIPDKDAAPFLHRLFINTTLPNSKYSKEEIADFVRRNQHHITGLNVSRHIKPYLSHYYEEDLFKLLEDIDVGLRINCVVDENEDVDKIKAFIKKYPNIQFRKDYTVTNADNCFSTENDLLYDKIKEAVSEDNEIIYDSNLEPNRCNFIICDTPEKTVAYHKTFPYSKLAMDDGSFLLVDVIIRADGELYDDWNDYGHPLDIKAYAERKEN